MTASIYEKSKVIPLPPNNIAPSQFAVRCMNMLANDIRHFEGEGWQIGQILLSDPLWGDEGVAVYAEEEDGNVDRVLNFTEYKVAFGLRMDRYNIKKVMVDSKIRYYYTMNLVRTAITENRYITKE